MFQNISEDFKEEDLSNLNRNNTLKYKFVIQNIFSKQNIILYIISYLISTVGFFQGLAPFALAMLASLCSNSIPIGLVFIITSIGTFIGFGMQGLLIYILTALVFIVSILIFKPKYTLEDRNEKQKLGVHIVISTLIVQVFLMLFNGFYVYDLLYGIALSILVYVFYKIFSNGIPFIKEYGNNKVFTIEEVIGASLFGAIACAGFGDLEIFGFSIKNILCILIVMILGWKNGILVGSASGITIGVALGIIGNSEPIILGIFALSGMLAGLLNRFGKIGVVVGFVIGNIVLIYIANGNTSPVIYFKEILIASLGLLVLPKNIEINIDMIFPKTKYFPVMGNRILEYKEETINKLNNVSQAISGLAQTYKEVAATVVEEEKTDINKNKEIFIENLVNSLEGAEKNLLYEDITKENSEIALDIFYVLEQNAQITNEDIIEIFKNYNNYIIGFENNDINLKVENDIQNMVKTINYVYKISRLNFIYRKKMGENKKNISNQLDDVSKVIGSLVNDMQKEEDFEKEKEEIKVILKQKDIKVDQIHIKVNKTGKKVINIYVQAYLLEQENKINKVTETLNKVLKEDIVLVKKIEDTKKDKTIVILNYMSKDKFTVQIGVAKATKSKSVVTGDSSIQTKLEDGKYLLAISDGMGSGVKARQSSQVAIKTLERLLTSGFDKVVSIDSINSAISLNTEDDMYATLDIAILDLYAGNIEFIKNGACQTFIKNKKDVQVIKSLSLPAGIIDKIDLTVYDKDIQDGDILVMCTDGVLDSKSEYKDKELWMKYMLEEIKITTPQKIADILLREAIDNGYGIAKDDMTIIIAKFCVDKICKK